MIIDAHTHLGFNSIVHAEAAQLIASMKRARINKACVFAGDLNACTTKKLLHEVEEYRGILFPVGAVSPFRKDMSVRQLDQWLRTEKLYGLKCYPGYEFFYPFDKRLRPYFRLLSAYGKPVVFHSGDTYSAVGKAKLKYAHPLHIDELAVEMPDLKIIIAHMGYPWVADAAEVCYKNKNVYADTSGFVYGTFTANDQKTFSDFVKTFVRIAGSSEKLLFGTDWPISDQKSYVACVRKMTRSNPAVMHATATHVFNLV